MNRRRPAALPSVLLLLALLLAVVGPSDAAPNRRRIAELRATLTSALRAGDYAAAERAIVALQDLTPDDPRLLYNLACVASRLGNPARAAAALRAAFRLGFDDVRRAETDPDLAPARADTQVAHLLDRWRRRLAERAAARALALRMGETSASLPLRWEPGGGDAPVTVRLRADATGWHLRCELPAAAWRDTSEGWWRGGGLLVTVALPDSGDTFDTRRAWRFGIGQRDGEPVGVLLQQPDRWVTTRVLELAPRVTWDPAGAVRRVIVDLPWRVFAPYAPPVDTLWGVNVRHCAPDDAGFLHVDSLVPDPAATVRDVVPARFVPVRLRPGRIGPLFHGRVARTVVDGRPLRIDLVAWSDTTLPVHLVTGVTDNDGRSVVSGGLTAAAETLRVGRNHWTRWADLSNLPDGPYRLSARLVLPDSATLDWRTGVFRFRPSWLAGAEEKLRDLPPRTRPTVAYRLDLLRRDLARRDPRADPTPLLTTVAEVNTFLRRWSQDGTLLAPGTTVLAAYTADDGTRRLCPLDVPPDWRPGAPAPVLVLAGDARLTTLLHDRLVADRDALPVLAAPALGRDDAGRSSPDDLITALGWLRELLGGPVWLAPLGGEGARLLAVVRDQAGLVDAVWEPATADQDAMVRDLIGWLDQRKPIVGN